MNSAVPPPRSRPTPARDQRGFTMLELLIVIGVIAIALSIAVVGIQRARIAANEASVIATLRVLGKAQVSYSASCGSGLFAATLKVLGTAPATGGEAFISPDMVPASGVGVDKSGYRMEMGGRVVSNGPVPCNGGPIASGYYLFADPLAPGSTGERFFWTNSRGTIYEHSASMSGQRMGGGQPTMGTALK